MHEHSFWEDHVGGRYTKSFFVFCVSFRAIHSLSIGLGRGGGWISCIPSELRALGSDPRPEPLERRGAMHCGRQGGGGTDSEVSSWERRFFQQPDASESFADRFLHFAPISGPIPARSSRCLGPPVSFFGGGFPY